jgi:hypothetical protein
VKFELLRSWYIVVNGTSNSWLILSLRDLELLIWLLRGMLLVQEYAIL